MAVFEIAYRRTGRFEGGYVHDPKDSGGETYNGISRVHNPNWDGWRIIDSMKNKPNFPSNLTQQKAVLSNMEMQLYKANYWNPVWGGKIDNQHVANDMYDTAVNMGVGTSIKLSQRQFKLPETGRMDEVLINKLNSVR